MGCGTSCARLLLIAFNFIFWLSGIAILGVGIWILVDPNLQDYQDVIHVSDQEYFKKAAYILLAFGAFVFLVGFCGCCGAIRNSKCLLGFYIFFLVIVFAGELAAGILAAIYKDQIIDELEAGLTKSIRNDYKDNAGPWDAVQKELKCCGGVNPSDYDNSTWQNANTLARGLGYSLIRRTFGESGVCTDVNSRGKIPSNGNPLERAMACSSKQWNMFQLEKVPLSCCELNNNKPVNQNACQSLSSDYHTKGCKDQLVNWVEDHSVILIGTGCGIAALQIFGLIFAVCLCRSIDKEKY